MKIAVLHNAVAAGASADERDVLDQLHFVEEALDRLGHESVAVPCTLDLEVLRRRLRQQRPQLVFNLVESLAGHDRLLFLVPALLDALDIPYTGSPTESLQLSTGKLPSKRRLAEAGLPVPRVAGHWPGPPPPRHSPFAVIVKSAWQHGSPGLDDGAVLPVGADLSRELPRLAPRLGGECLAEAYIEGRELNLALLEGPAGFEVLPPAEILFEDYPEGKPRIVGFEAKWQADSFEYGHTPRRFVFPRSDRELLEQLSILARRAARALGVRGYCRVDFRVDRQGRPWVLEVNANPCLAPDAGFVAALRETDLSFAEAVERLLEVALRGEAVDAVPVGGR